MASSSLTLAETVAMLQAVADRMIASEPALSEADRQIGDGDHGLGMQRGMTATKEKLAAGGFASLDQPFAAVGMAMMSATGGASGAIFGTLFRSGGRSLAKRDAFDAAGLAAFLQAALEGVQTRGKAEPGDKTVVDALAAAAAKASETTDRPLAEALREVAAATEIAVEQTKQMTAKFGRAKSLGDQSIGYVDPGALSLSVMLGAMKDFSDEGMKSDVLEP